MAELSPLRRRMIEDMTVRDMSPATQRSYISAVSKFSRYFGKSPERLDLEDVRAFQVHLVSTGISWPGLNQIVCALRFFYGVTLDEADVPERIPYARAPRKLPTVLSADVNDHLEANGIAPIETDLGEYIIQLRHEPPSHIIAPAFHLTKEQVADTFRDAHRSWIHRAPDRTQRRWWRKRAHVLRQKFEDADAGITGANFLVGRDGAAIIVTNEGNGDLSNDPAENAHRAGRHREGDADLDDAAVLLRLLPRSATGPGISTYQSS